MIFELNVHEKPLDTLVDHLQKNQLDETINIDALEKTCLQLIVGDLFWRLSQWSWEQFSFNFQGHLQKLLKQRQLRPQRSACRFGKI